MVMLEVLIDEQIKGAKDAESNTSVPSIDIGLRRSIAIEEM